MSGAPDLPIACTLGADDLRARLAWIGRVTEQHLVSHHLDGATLHLRYAQLARRDLERIVAAERRCCAFLRFDLAQEDTLVTLRIHAPADLDLDARWLFAQFVPVAAGGGCGCAQDRGMGNGQSPEGARIAARSAKIAP